MPILKYLENKPFATFKWPFATLDNAVLYAKGYLTLFQMNTSIKSQKGKNYNSEKFNLICFVF